MNSILKAHKRILKLNLFMIDDSLRNDILNYLLNHPQDWFSYILYQPQRSHNLLRNLSL